MDVKSLFRVSRGPATQTTLATLRSACGSLPASYLGFLGMCVGAESCFHDRDGDCLVLWSSWEIAELNAAYQVARWVPELLVIGSDGGDDAIGFDRGVSLNPELWPVVRIGFGNLDKGAFVVL